MKGLRIISVLFLLVLSSSLSFGQSWEVIFKKAEKKYAKTKYNKVEKKVAKIRKKGIDKKYRGDSSIVPMTYVMAAKANMAMADYQKMNENLAIAGKKLPDAEIGHPYNYTMAQLRMVDLYNEYGTPYKADSICTILGNLTDNYLQSDLLRQEIDIRRAITAVAMGRFTEGIELAQALYTTWPMMFRMSYNFDKITSQDEAYKEALMVKLYTAEIEAMIGKGEYAKATELIDTFEKQVNRLVDSNTEAYIDFKVAEINSFLDYGDLKSAEKMTKRLLNVNPKGRLFDKVGYLSFLLSLKDGDYDEAVGTAQTIENRLKSAKVDRKFIDLNTEFLKAVIMSYENDLEKNAIPSFNTLSGKIKKQLPADHVMMTTSMEEGIRYIFNQKRVENYPIAEKFYISLDESLNARFGSKGLPTAINRINMAGYYLGFSEEPAKAFALLAGDSYKIPLSELSPNHPQYERMVTSLMEYFTLIGNFDYPIKLTKSVIEAMKANPNTSEASLGDKLTDLAKLQVQGGYYKDAETNTDEALKILKRGGEKKSESYVRALNSAAYLYGTIGLYSKAERQLRKSESVFKKLETVNKELRLQSIVDLASLNTRIGNYSETEELLNTVIQERLKLYGSTSRHMIKPYMALGEMFMIRGDYPSAEKNLRKALLTTEQVFGDSTLIFAESLSRMVKLYVKLGNYEAALVNAFDVLKIREKVLRPDHILLADTYNDLGTIYQSKGGQQAIVAKYFILSKDITEKNFGNKHPLYAEAIKNVAYVHIENGEFSQALILLDQADDIWRDAFQNQNPSSGEVARMKGDIYSYQSNFKQARREYEKASRYFKRIFSEEHPEYLNTQSRLARAYYINNELSDVESILDETTTAYLDYTKTYFPTLSEEEKAKFWNKIKPDFEFYNTVAVRYSESKEKYLENMYDFALATKGLLLSSSLKTRNSILNSKDPELIALFKNWISKKEFLTTTLAQSEEELAENQIDVGKLKDEIQLLEKQLSESSDDFEDSFEYKFYSWSDVRKSLNENEAAVEIIRYREFDEHFNEDKIRYAALIVTSETKSNPMLVKFDNGNDMEIKHFKYHRNTTKYKVADDNSFGVFWEPIYNKVKDKDIVFLSPDGVYNQLNVESLKIGEGNFVIDEMNVRVVGNTKSIAAVRSREGKKTIKKAAPTELTAMLLGNPQYYESDENRTQAIKESNNRGKDTYVPQLPGTEKEVNTINELLESKGWKIESYLGLNATEEQIKQAQNYTLIHIATHGFFDDKPKEKTNGLLSENDDNPLERSGLITEGGGDVLAKATKNYNIQDGVLTAHEAMNLNFENTQLIVLSACETGRGEIQQGEGVFGLQRSFLVAGADAIVMSLYQVSDEVTQMLMVEFYKNWLSGQDKRTAFNNAQRTIKESYAEPIYWGAFTMIAKS